MNNGGDDMSNYPDDINFALLDAQYRGQTPEEIEAENKLQALADDIKACAPMLKKHIPDSDVVTMVLEKMYSYALEDGNLSNAFEAAKSRGLYIQICGRAMRLSCLHNNDDDAFINNTRIWGCPPVELIDTCVGGE
jgi:hypothetical protein